MDGVAVGTVFFGEMAEGVGDDLCEVELGMMFEPVSVSATDHGVDIYIAVGRNEDFIVNIAVRTV